MSQISRTLEMIFTTELDKNHTIRVYDAKSDITAEEVAAVMDNIISRNIFAGAGGDLTGKAGAKLVTTQVDEFELT